MQKVNDDQKTSSVWEDRLYFFLFFFFFGKLSYVSYIPLNVKNKNLTFSHKQIEWKKWNVLFIIES